VLISKINCEKLKNIILMRFRVKNTLKNNNYHNIKHYLKFLKLTLFFKEKILNDSIKVD